ncbi:MAG: sensor signal transduction histidine kinase [Bacteroidetes bacterium]|nr:sensor signal transduction histidine kinase [Bacteroidota bacterium]
MKEARHDKFTEHQLITELFDHQPDSVVWFVPHFGGNDDGLPVDFEVGYCNNAAVLILNAPKSRIIGSFLTSSALMDEASRMKILAQCMQVWKSGESIEFTYYSAGLDKHFNVQRSRILGGVLSITRDHTNFVKTQTEKEEQSRFLNQIIESSSSGISLYEAVRDKNGKIIDFKLKIANQKSADITAFSLEELYKYTVKELMLIRAQSNYFEMLVKVTETGNPVFTEYYSPGRDQWIAFSIQKFDDGYLLNYIDITHTKNLEKKAKEQAEMLNGILNASITGLIALQAVYDAAGRIDDFRFVLINNAAEKLLGIRQEEKDKTYLELFPNAKANGFFDLYKTALTTGEPIVKEFFYKGEGYNGWYYISVSKMNADTLVQSFADITNTREPQGGINNQ